MPRSHSASRRYGQFAGRVKSSAEVGASFLSDLPSAGGYGIGGGFLGFPRSGRFLGGQILVFLLDFERFATSLRDQAIKDSIHKLGGLRTSEELGEFQGFIDDHSGGVEVRGQFIGPLPLRTLRSVGAIRFMGPVLGDLFNFLVEGRSGHPSHQ